MAEHAVLSNFKKAVSGKLPRYIQVHGENRENKSGIINPAASIRHSLLLVRYLLFILTSLFYLAGPPESVLGIKLLVVLAMLGVTLITSDLYDSREIKNVLDQIYTPRIRKNRSGNILPLLTLITIETVGIAVLLMPTGGMDSPFTWYALNPIIAAAVYLPLYSCWGVMGLFICSALISSSLIPGTNFSLAAFTMSHLGIFLVFCLATGMARVAASLYQKLAEAYYELDKAHKETENSLSHISSLYQALEAFSAGEDSAELAELLAAYSHKLCGKPSACFLAAGTEAERDSDINKLLKIAGDDSPDRYRQWENEMQRLWERVKTDRDSTQFIHVGSGLKLVYVPVAANGEYFGILACRYSDTAGGKKQAEENIDSLSYLANLGGITLERLKIDRLWGRFLVNNEQNRIANEIHDGVSQYLFSMACALDMLKKRDGTLQDEDIQQQLQLVEDTARRASRELRSSIYKLSPHKRGENVFVDSLASYLDNLGRMNGIKVDLQAEGSEETLSPALRKALYRIIREACSNALRHGRCKSLQISLSMNPVKTVLEVADDGQGYREIPAAAGLGIRNMKQVTALFGGELQLKSQPGKGTQVKCTIPGVGRERENKEAVSE